MTKKKKEKKKERERERERERKGKRVNGSFMRERNIYMRVCKWDYIYLMGHISERLQDLLCISTLDRLSCLGDTILKIGCNT